MSVTSAKAFVRMLDIKYDDHNISRGLMIGLFHADGTRFARVWWLFEEFGVSFEKVELQFSPVSLKTSEHREQHPLGRVPVLEDGRTRIFESGAIVQYLLSKYGGGRMVPEESSDAYPLYLQWFHYTEGTMMPPINIIVQRTKNYKLTVE